MKNIIKNSCLAVSVVLSTGLHAEVDHAHGKNIKDYEFTSQYLHGLSNARLTQLADDQFVFNNELAALNWNDTFASYFPHLKPYQEVIMHYAGYYSINPKMLLALAEHQSRLVTEPSDASYQSPFGELSDQVGFKEQVKDVSSKLAKRFYAYKKLMLKKEKSNFVEQNNYAVNSAASVAFVSLLRDSDTRKAKKGSDIASLKNSDMALSNYDHTVKDVLTAYEDVFAQSSLILTDIQSDLGRSNKEGIATGVKQMASASLPNLYLPWTSGWSWKSSGAHGFDGSSWPLSSLDLYYPDGNTGWGGNKPAVYASHGGTVTWYSRCNMRITHPSGLATNYYHMDNLQYGTGSWVNAGTYIGSYANDYNASLCEGGQSTGPHLHISLLWNGYYQSLQGYNFSGYYVQVGTYQYDSNCSRSYLWKNGYTYCPGDRIYKPYE